MTNEPQRTRAARLHAHGKALVVEEVALPVAGGGEIVVDMAFAGVNPVDRYTAEGRVAPEGPVPRTIGMEGTGRAHGLRLRGLIEPVERMAAGKAAVLAALADGRLRVAVAERLPLERVNDAFAALVDRQVSGKIVLDLGA